ALTANTSLVGKANFGFVSKYKKGSSTVEGNTEFQFTAGDINFKSTLHESGSLVISGAKATYRGVGTINGVAGYKFTLVAIDGNWNNGTGADRFRIKITTTSGGVVYDNQMGKDENGDDATVLGGGSIVIHEVKKKTSNRMEAPAFVLAPQDFNVKVLGNPSLTTFRLQLQSNNMQEKFTVKVVDVNGRLIEVQQNLYTGQVIELGSKYTQGTYFAEVMQGTNRKVVKLVKISRD
ncbi:MAG TPA: T9SS type A sorting domain-containing protein, partial [Lacibacter sp.]|nr:T9SS type A sorting domain-containing protein [Lacibacter sp.]